ncbi:hypothetical protein AALB52_21895 [Lachnospiraceae bacterium 38-14]
MYWIQETGTNKNSPGYRLFYAETIQDINLMPTNLKKGSQDNGDTVANQVCSLGSECLCLENSGHYILSNSGWTKIVNNISSGNVGDTATGGGCNCEGVTIIQNDDTEPIPNREILSLFGDNQSGTGGGNLDSDDNNQIDIESIPHEKIESLFS